MEIYSSPVYCFWLKYLSTELFMSLPAAVLHSMHFFLLCVCVWGGLFQSFVRWIKEQVILSNNCSSAWPGLSLFLLSCYAARDGL